MKQIKVTSDNIDQMLSEVTHDNAKDADELQEKALRDAFSPDKLLLYMNDILAGKTIRQGRIALVEAGKRKGLSGVRPGDYITLLPMCEDERANGGAVLRINYMFYKTEFGRVFLASTDKGLCHMTFVDGKDEAGLAELRGRFPAATYKLEGGYDHRTALAFLANDTARFRPMFLHVDGSHFELAVWSALLNIPMGDVVSYGDLAEMIGKSKTAGRAVGTAVAGNSIAFLIPCHRVIKGSGQFGAYAWGSMRKAALIGWEATTVYSEPEVWQNDDLVN
jgi:AraC family transcriptional regulator of adaptative response/methylated-DNA-[protein]-cysteine methyltransferase